MRTGKRWGIVAAGAFAIAGCTADMVTNETDTGEDAVVASDVLSGAQIAELRGASFSSEEIDAVAKSVSISEQLGVESFVKEANDGNAARGIVRRESHGKSQGCLRARVDVTTASGAGVFRPGASYAAWVRLSNGGAYQKDDKSQHISRGWGIKLLDVAGTPNGSQDFLFITSPRFFIRDITHYPGFLKASGNGRLGFAVNLFFGMSGEERDVIFHRIRLKVRNLLESPEYSAVPYRYGSEVVKYALAPCSAGAPPAMPQSQEPPEGSGEDYLEDAMNASLSRGDVCYAFHVQKPRSDREDPIDNPTKAWEGAFERVATITIPAGQQKGGPSDYTANADECERMAFDPWNATRENQPVGKTNWTRKAVYGALADFRRVELPQIYEKWLANKEDPTIKREIRRELGRLRTPASVAPPTVKATHEPGIDDGFRTLGIVQ